MKQTASTEKKRGTTKKTAMINVPSNWFAAEDENYNYICNTEQSYSIYKISKGEGELLRLNEDECWYLNLSGDFLYYCNKSDQGHIYKIKKDGTERIKVYEDSASYLNVNNDWLYYCNNTDNNRIYKIRTDGSCRESLNHDASEYLFFYEGWLFYANLNDNGKLYKVKEDGNGKIKLSEDRARYLSVFDNWVYYNREDKKGSLYKVHINGASEGKMELNKERSENIIAITKHIYYISVDKDYKLFRIKTDGKGKKKLTDDEVAYLNCLSDSIYYLNNSDDMKLYTGDLAGIKRRAVGIEESKSATSNGTQLKCGNSAGNIVNYGIAAIEGDWLYYNDGYALCKEHINGSGQMKLVEERTSFLNVIDNWIYYASSDNLNIYKIRTDGSGKTIVNSDRSTYFIVIGDWIYYVNESDDSKIYKIRTDGSEKNKISDVRATCLNYTERLLVFINLDDASPKKVNIFGRSEPDFGRIYKMKLDGSDLSPLSSDETEEICVVEGWVYYLSKTDNNSIYRVDINAKTTNKVNDLKANYLNCADNWLYFVSSDSFNINSIYKIRPNGTGLKTISEYVIGYINVVDDWIYFLIGGDFEQVCRIRTDGSGYSPLYKRGKAAKHLRVKFEDGKSYIYRTFDQNIKLGSKVMVEGKKTGFVGEVIEEDAKYNKNADAQYISEVISYGTRNIDDLSDKAKKGIDKFVAKKSRNNIVLEVKKSNHRNSKPVYCKTKDLDIGVGTVVVFQTTWMGSAFNKYHEEIGVVTKKRVKGVRMHDAYQVIDKFPEGSKLEDVLKEKADKELEVRKKFKSDIVKVVFDDNRKYSYRNTDPKLDIGSVVQVIRGGKSWEGKVVMMNVEPKPTINYLSIGKVLSYGEDEV